MALIKYVAILLILASTANAALDWEEVKARDAFKDLTLIQWNFLIRQGQVRRQSDEELVKSAAMLEAKFYRIAKMSFTPQIDHEGMTALEIGTEYLAQLQLRKNRIALMLKFYALCKKEQELRL